MADIQTDETKGTVPTQTKAAQEETLAGSPSLMARSYTPHHPAKPGRGRLTKATPELTRAVHNIQSAQDRLDHDIAHLNDDKARLVEQISSLELQLKSARESGLSKATVKRLESLLVEAQDKLKMLSGIIPERSLSRDRETMEEILKKWRAYDHERSQQAIAENKFNKNPEDKRAEGDINRSRAAAYTLNQEIETLVKLGEERIIEATPNPILEESISYSHEQAIADEKLRAQAKGTQATPSLAEEEQKEPVPTIVVSEVLDIEPVLKEKIPLVPTPEFKPDLDESLSYTHGQALGDEKLRAQKKDTQVLPLPTAETLEKLVEEVPAILVESPSEITAAPKEQPAVKKVTIKKPPEPVIFTKAANETTAALPPETLPDNTQIITYADNQIRKHIDFLFGKKGFLGFGSKSGMDSPHWKDSLLGFAEKTVAEIMGAHPKKSDSPNAKLVGVENFVATQKILDYLMVVLSKTAVHPENGERVKDYLKRAAAITIGRFMDEKGILPSTKDDFNYDKELQAIVSEKPQEIKIAEEKIALPTIEKPESPAPEIKPEQAEVIAAVPEVDLDPVIWEDTHPLIEETGPAPKMVIEEEKPIPTVIVPELLDIEPVLKEEIPLVPTPEFKPDLDESLSYTREQAIAAEELRAQKKPVEKVAAPMETISTKKVEASTEKPTAPLAAALAESLARPLGSVETGTEQMMPQEILPNDPQVIAYADMEVRKHLDSLFGTKGFLGFGAKPGIESPHWSDPLFGFGNRTVAEIMEVEPEKSPAPGTKLVGIQNYAATEKMQDYLMLALSETGVHPEPEEKTEEYLKRAAAITIDKFMQKEGVPPQI